MKLHPNATTIAIFFLFTLIWFALHASTSELTETNIIPLLEHDKIPQHQNEYPTNMLGLLHEIKEKIKSLQQKYDENTNIILTLESASIPQELAQNFTNRFPRFNEIKQQIIFLQQKLPKPPNTLTLYNAINNKHYVSAIFFQFLTMQDILILRGTCKNFQILLQPNKQNDMVIFCKNFSKDIYEAPLKWVDLKYLLDQSYVYAFSKIEMFNIKKNEYALLIHYIVPICHQNIISWHNKDIDYPQILFDRATKEIFENEQVDHKLLLPHYDCPLIIYNGYRNAWAKITKERNVLTGGDTMYEGDPTQLKNVKNIVSTSDSFAALLDDGHIVAWGDEYSGGVIPDETQTQLQNVKMIFSSGHAFAALLDDGHVVAWGNEHTGGNIPDEIQTQVQNVKMIFSNFWAFTALLDDGHVVAWGNENYGGIIPDETQLKLQNVKMMFSNDNAFVALLDDESVFSWGISNNGDANPTEINKKSKNDHP